VSFIEKPEIAFDIDALYMSLTAIPGFQPWLYHTITGTIASLYLWPKAFVLPMYEGELPADAAIPKGMVRVHIKEGVDFPKMDMLGSCDPFLVLTIGGQEFKTKVLKSVKNPKWDESFEFECFNPDLEELTIEARDWDRVGTSDSIGSCVYPLRNLNGSTFEELSLPLQNAKKGKIIFSVEYAPFQPDVESLTTDLDYYDVGEHPNFPSDDSKQENNRGLNNAAAKSFYLYVSVVSASDLPDARGNYLVKSVLNEQHSLTNTVKKNNNPVWDDEFRFVVQDPVHDFVQFDVMSQSALRGKKVIGNVKIPMNKLIVGDALCDNFTVSDCAGAHLRVKVKLVASSFERTTRLLLQN